MDDGTLQLVLYLSMLVAIGVSATVAERALRGRRAARRLPRRW